LVETLVSMVRQSYYISLPVARPSENLKATASHGLDASEAEPSNGPEENAGTNPPTEWDSLDSEAERAITEDLKAEEPENWEFHD
jgi:hypothetical protein